MRQGFPVIIFEQLASLFSRNVGCLCSGNQLQRHKKDREAIQNYGRQINVNTFLFDF